MKIELEQWGVVIETVLLIIKSDDPALWGQTRQSEFNNFTSRKARLSYVFRKRLQCAEDKKVPRPRLLINALNLPVTYLDAGWHFIYDRIISSRS